MLTFNYLPFHCFVQVINEIWYLRRRIIALPGNQISVIPCTKWWNDERLKVSDCFVGKCSFLKIRLHYVLNTVLYSCVCLFDEVAVLSNVSIDDSNWSILIVKPHLLLH